MIEVWDIQTKEKVRLPADGQDPKTMPMAYYLMYSRLLGTLIMLRRFRDARPDHR
jgi:hypothetical protein